MPRFEVRGADGTFVRSDEANIHRSGDWLAWALGFVHASNGMPAYVSIYPLYIAGSAQPDWPPEQQGDLYPVMNLRGLIDRLLDIDKELDPK